MLGPKLREELLQVSTLIVGFFVHIPDLKNGGTGKAPFEGANRTRAGICYIVWAL